MVDTQPLRGWKAAAAAAGKCTEVDMGRIHTEKRAEPLILKVGVAARGSEKVLRASKVAGLSCSEVVQESEEYAEDAAVGAAGSQKLNRVVLSL